MRSASTCAHSARPRTTRRNGSSAWATNSSSAPTDCPACSAAYGLDFDGSPRTMDLGLLYRALNAHQVDMIAANSTDGPIQALRLTALEDDKHYFPPYQAVPLVRDEALARWPEIRAALDALAGTHHRRRHARHERSRRRPAPRPRRSGARIPRHKGPLINVPDLVSCLKDSRHTYAVILATNAGCPILATSLVARVGKHKTGPINTVTRCHPERRP